MKLLINVVFSVVLLVASLSYYFWIGKKEERVKPVVQKKTGLHVTLQKPKKVNFTVTLDLWGEVKYSRLVEIKSEVEGRVLSVPKHFRPGRRVSQDQEIVVIDKERLELRNQEVQANIFKVDADLKQMTTEAENLILEIALAEENVKHVKKDVEIHEDLARKKSISPLTLSSFKQALIRQKIIVQQLKSKLQMIPLKKRALEASIKALKSSLDLLNVDLEDAIIKAPFKGVILGPVVSAGDYLRKGDVVCRIYDPLSTELWLPIGLSEKQKLGSVRNVTLKGVQKKDFWFLGEADRELQSDTLIVKLDMPGLKSGELVKAEIAGRVLKDVFVLPQSALRDDQKSIYLVVDGKLKIQTVEIVMTNHANIYISKGLAISDSVVISRLQDIAEGTLINQPVKSVSKKEKGAGGKLR